MLVPKRMILQTIASNYDLFNYCGPLLNRSRLFLHSLQCDSKLGLYESLSSDRIKEWRNISKQLNSSGIISIKRFIGQRSDSYRLIAYVDSSSVIYGAVIFIESKTTKLRSFLLAKNRIINRQLEGKSIPVLELQAVVLGTEMLQELRGEFSGSACVLPVNIQELILCSDSQVCIDWLNNSCNKLEKMNRKPVFVKNRIETILRLCSKFPVEYRFCAGLTNPSDCITRPMSYKKLVNSTYFTGVDIEDTDLLPKIIIPNPNVTQCFASSVSDSKISKCCKIEPLLDSTRFSSLKTLLNVYKYVMLFIKKLKSKLSKNSGCQENLVVMSTEATNMAILFDQHQNFPEIFSYFQNKSVSTRSMPDIVARLNVFLDTDGLLKVRCKKKSWGSNVKFPILMSKSSHFCKLFILHVHHKLNHGGAYNVLAELREKFWIAHGFSCVKRVLRACIVCRKVNNRTVKLNTNEYRDFRMDPPNIPFRFCIMDHLNNVKSIIMCIFNVMIEFIVD